jgi:hypothetical protein
MFPLLFLAYVIAVKVFKKTTPNGKWKTIQVSIIVTGFIFCRYEWTLCNRQILQLRWNWTYSSHRDRTDSSIGNATDLYSGGSRFERRPRHQLSWLRLSLCSSVLPGICRGITSISSLFSLPQLIIRLSSFHPTLYHFDIELTNQPTRWYFSKFYETWKFISVFHVPILSQDNPVHATPSYPSKLHFNITLPPTSKSY